MLRLRTFGGLWVEGEDGARREGVRPRRLALLAVLAAAGTKGRTRDQVLAILWPDSSPDRARAVLSQTLYSLSSDLGTEVVLATATDLRLDPSRLTCDVDDFRKGTSAQDWRRAAALYAGWFLDGFYLNDAPEFERWVEAERAALAHEGARAIERVAREATQNGRVDEAVEHWERLTRIEPLSSANAVEYMKALVERGDRTAALAHGQAHAALVRAELETDPEPEVVRLLARLRAGGAKLAAHDERAAPLAPVLLFEEPSQPHPVVTPAAARPRRRMMAAAIASVVILGLLGWRATFLIARASDAPVLAVGQVRDLVSPDSVQLGGVLSEMLATSIGRLTQLQVIANSRLLEIIPRGRETERSARSDAARRAGATQVLEGELIPLSGSRLRFEVRRLDLARGIVRAGYRIDGDDRMTLFDSVAVLVAADLGVSPPSRSLADASTRSPIAYRLYEEGLRALTLQDTRTARQLFSAAVREDSTFAMAQYYLCRSEVALEMPEQYATAERAFALAPRAADRDRLLILTYVVAMRSDPAGALLADTLVSRYPNDPEALVLGASTLPDLSRTVSLLNRAIAIDSAAGVEASIYCRLCEAFSALAGRYSSADSIVATERTIQRWIRFRPRDSAPLGFLSEFLVGLGRRADAEIAYQRASALGARTADQTERRLIWGLRSDDIAAANRECTGLSDHVASNVTFRWFCSISLRMQGRFREALRLAEMSPKQDAMIAIVHMNSGNPEQAARGFLQIARRASEYYASSPGLLARNVTWNLTLAATAFVEGGDTTSARRLIDSVEATGRRSGFPRDQLLHHFLRGLLLARADHHDSAAGQFRAALSSPSQGYTRINYELAKSLLALNRATEAIPLMRAPLHGGLDGSGLYLTRTEVHESLAKLFEAAGQRDSAAAHYAIVEQAWRHADPALAARYASVRKRLDALKPHPFH